MIIPAKTSKHPKTRNNINNLLKNKRTLKKS